MSHSCPNLVSTSFLYNPYIPFLFSSIFLFTSCKCYRLKLLTLIRIVYKYGTVDNVYYGNDMFIRSASSHGLAIAWKLLLHDSGDFCNSI